MRQLGRRYMMFITFTENTAAFRPGLPAGVHGSCDDRNRGGVCRGRAPHECGRPGFARPRTRHRARRACRPNLVSPVWCGRGRECRCSNSVRSFGKSGLLGFLGGRLPPTTAPSDASLTSVRARTCIDAVLWLICTGLSFVHEPVSPHAPRAKIWETTYAQTRFVGRS